MKKMKFILAFLSLGLCLSSCIEDDNFADELKESPMVYGFDSSGETYIILPTDTQIIEQKFKVELKGGATGTTASTDMTFRYEISSSTTAVEGVNFEILNTSNTFTVPANRDFSETELEITIDPTSFNVGEQSQIVINLIPLDDSVATASPFAPLILDINKCDPPLIGSYTAANTVNGSSNGDGEAVNIEALGCNLYRADNLPNFNGVFTWDFILNNDNTITLTGTLDSFSNTISGSGILLANGTIQINDFDISNNAQDMSFDLIP